MLDLARLYAAVLLLGACGSGEGGPDGPPSSSDGVPPDAPAGDGSVGLDAPADGDIPSAPTPPVGDPLIGLELFDGWTEPRALPAPVNTTGWEDSAFISADGRTLYFGYTRYDYTALSQNQMLVVTGPDRPGQHGNAFDIYEARISGAAWIVDNSTVNDPDPNLSEAAIGVDAWDTTMVYVKFPVGMGTSADMYLAHKVGSSWSNIQALPAPLNTPCTEDNPTLSRDGATLYWDSNRVDVAGMSCRAETAGPVRNFYRSHFDGSAWSMPEKITSGPAQPPFHWQAFVDDDGESFYFSGADAVSCSNGCLYKSTRLCDGSYGAPAVVARVSGTAAGSVSAIGEMSITADHRFLYFVYQIRDATGHADLSIGVAHR
jgi:hypothetical protein